MLSHNVAVTHSYLTTIYKTLHESLVFPYLVPGAPGGGSWSGPKDIGKSYIASTPNSRTKGTEPN